MVSVPGPGEAALQGPVEDAGEGLGSLLLARSEARGEDVARGVAEFLQLLPWRSLADEGVEAGAFEEGVEGVLVRRVLPVEDEDVVPFQGVPASGDGEGKRQVDGRRVAEGDPAGDPVGVDERAAGEGQELVLAVGMGGLPGLAGVLEAGDGPLQARDGGVIGVDAGGGFRERVLQAAGGGQGVEEVLAADAVRERVGNDEVVVPYRPVARALEARAQAVGGSFGKPRSQAQGMIHEVVFL